MLNSIKVGRAGFETKACYGVGFNVVVDKKDKVAVMKHINQFYDCYEIGTIEKRDNKVEFGNRLNWL